MTITHNTQKSTSDLLLRLAALEPLAVPDGEPGIAMVTKPEQKYIPVLSVYLDLRPQVQGARPALRPSRVILRERLHQIEATFEPRGAALEAIRDDAAKIERYLDSEVSADTSGLALFVSEPHHLFEALAVDIPFESQVVASAIPDLFQLARALADQEIAVVAIVELNAARLFLLHQGGLRELRGLADDPKYYHMVHSANAMSQAHYQRHAQHKRAEFATEVGDQIEQLVARGHVTQVILAGEVEAIPLVREALSPRVAQLVRELHPPLASLEVATPADAIREEIMPLLREAKAEQDRTTVEKLVEAVRADRLGVAGLELTQRALANGQVETLILPAGLESPPGVPSETRTELIEQATRTDASIAIVDSSVLLQQLGGVGALLRYRT